MYVNNHMQEYIYLLNIEVHKSMLEALIYYWDPTYNVFSFNKCDLLPIIEEYTNILEIEISRPMHIFDAPFEACSIDQIESHFRISYEEWYQA